MNLLVFFTSRRFTSALFLTMALFIQNAMAESYQAPAWLPGGHLQTIYTAMFASTPQVDYRRERWELADGDFIDLDWVDGSVDAPLVVMFHGMEGSSRSHYALSLMAAVQKKGWRGVVAHFRGCSGEPNRLPRAYHAGDSAEIDAILGRLKASNPSAPLYATGVSLGGNALLKWLGEKGEDAYAVVDKAVTISATMDLTATGHALDAGFNRFYAGHFLTTLKQKALYKLQAYPALFDGEVLAATTTLYGFDGLVTAPLHGYKNTDDYWQRASSKPGLINIRVPTLIINAQNDPFLPAEFLPTPSDVSTAVTLEFPEEGGHVGFISGPFPGRLDWLPKRIISFFDVNAESQHHAVSIDM